MGLISSAIDSALESVGSGMMDAGEWMLQGGYGMWKSCSEITMQYVQKSPMTETNAWTLVTGSIYSLAMGVAASLAVLFFVMGWLRESIDIRNNFTLENTFRFFVRFAITVSLIVNSLALVQGIVQCSTAVVSTMSIQMQETEVDGIFEELRDAIKEDDSSDGGTWLAMGFGCMIGGLLGGLVIIVCAVTLVLSVLSRLFKLLLCIPFAPVAFAGFAGGAEFSQSGIAWLRTFIGYALEAVVIALAISISFGLFQDAGLFGSSGGEVNMVTLILQICEYCMPMITACVCVKGAEMTVRRCLGLG